MRKYEEEHYRFENIKDYIYPWVKGNVLADSQALNGKNISEKDTPVVSFMKDLVIIFVIKRGDDIYEVLKDNMLPPDCDIEELYYTSCENLVRDVEFTIANTMYGGFAMMADGYHEVSALCFKHIWQVCVDKILDDLVIMAPRRDTLLFVPASNKRAVEELKEQGKQLYEYGPDKISDTLLLFSKDRRELTVYET